MESRGPKWEKVDALLDRVLEIDQGERHSFLDRLPPGEVDPDVVAQVRRMLPGLEAGSSPLDRPVMELLGEAFWESSPSGDAPAVGRHLGPYRIDAVLGQGGMGRVFAATRDDGEFTQKVALKVLRWEFADHPAVERFRTERQLLATLDHPGIARLIDGGVTASGLPYLVMERVNGTTIDAYCRDHDLSLTERVELMREVCEVVEHAHRNLVVHRDLKPSNIMITESGAVKLLDFGIAKMLAEDTKLTRDEQVPLTPNYGAPEQIRGDRVTPATDVYALGVILHELATGIRPHEADAPPAAELARRIAAEDPPLPSASTRNVRGPAAARQLRGDLDSIILKALSRDPGGRYPSAERLGDDLHRYLNRRPVNAVQAGTLYRMDRFVRRNRVTVGATALLVASLAFGFAATMAQAEKARRESQRARVEAQRAATVAAMLTDLFGLADPFVTGGAIRPQELLRRGVTDARHRLRDDPVTRAALLTALGEGFTDVGEYAEAYPILEEAMALARAVGDPDVLAGALAALGELELQRRSYDAAGMFLEEALAEQESVGPGRKQALILAALARQRFGIGDAQGALAFSDSALAVFSAWDPDNHRDRLRTYAFRGPIARALGDTEGAVAIYDEVLQEARASLPATDQLITATLNNIAYLRKQLGDLPGAEAAYREALKLLEAQVGPAHPDPVRVRTNLAAVIDDDPERIPEAEQLIARNVALLRDLGPPGTVRLERALTGMTGAYLAWGMPGKAEAAAREAIMLTRDLPDGAPTARRLHELRLALAVRQQNREAEAARLFAGAVGGLREGGTLNSSARGVLNWLAGFYEKAGFPDSATELRDLSVELDPAAS